jgi:hypothetical protein
VDYGFGAVSEGLVVAGQAAVMHEPAEGPLDNPTPRNHLEALLGGIAASDFYINVEAGTMVDDFGSMAYRMPSVSPRSPLRLSTRNCPRWAPLSPER